MSRRTRRSAGVRKVLSVLQHALRASSSSSAAAGPRTGEGRGTGVADNNTITAGTHCGLLYYDKIVSDSSLLTDRAAVYNSSVLWC